MDYLEKAKRVFDIEIRELQRLRERLGDDFTRAVGLIKDAVDARGKVVVVGVGKSGHVGGKIASTLTSTGSPAGVVGLLHEEQRGPGGGLGGGGGVAVCFGGG